MMTRHEQISAPDLPIQRHLGIERIGRSDVTAVSERLTEEECLAVATFLGVIDVAGVRLDGELRRWQSGWKLEARLRGTVIQSCVVSLAPVTATVDTAVERQFLPANEIARSMPIEFSLEGEDPPEPVEDHVDLGQVLIESLALSIDPWPRAPGAKFGQKLYAGPGIEPMTDEAARPFAGLAELRAKLSQGGA